MPGTISLVVTAGPIRGQRFDFPGHDTFVFGRAPQCHARLASSDASASRHHFLLEVNPPLARLRDLGSLNGTHVNGVRHGGRRTGESPEEAATRERAEVDLRHGDEIRVGATVIRVEVSGVDRPGLPPVDASPLARLAAKGEAENEGAAPGSTVGPYAIERLLGKGGMGAVYLARRLGDEPSPPVALKVMLPRMVVDEGAQEIFIREIEVTRALRHPNIVGLLDFGKHQGRFYFALEYCAGGSAEQLRRRHGGRVPLPSTLHVAVGAARGTGRRARRRLRPPRHQARQRPARRGRRRPPRRLRPRQELPAGGPVRHDRDRHRGRDLPVHAARAAHQLPRGAAHHRRVEHGGHDLLPAHRPVRPRLRRAAPTPWPSS